MPTPDGDVLLVAEILQAEELIIDEGLEAPTLAGGFSSKSVRMGKNAASVLPDAVDAVSRTLSSVLKIASAAATWMPRRFSQSWS